MAWPAIQSSAPCNDPQHTRSTSPWLLDYVYARVHAYLEWTLSRRWSYHCVVSQPHIFNVQQAAVIIVTRYETCVRFKGCRLTAAAMNLVVRCKSAPLHNISMGTLLGTVSGEQSIGTWKSAGHDACSMKHVMVGKVHHSMSRDNQRFY